MPNKQLTAKVRLNTSQAEKSIDNLIKKINRLDAATRRVANANNKQNQQYNKTQQQVTTITSKVKAWAIAQKQVASSTKSTNSALSSIGGKLKGIAATYLGIMGGRAVMNTTDLLVGAQNRLNHVNGGNTIATQEALDKMYASSQKVRTSYQDMISNVSKTMTLAGGAFGNNIDNAIRFQEIMAEAYAVGGASDQEKSTSMYQLTQALGSGYLQGDELRSVREGAPLAYKAIEEFAQGVFNTEKSLKDMASQGMITSELVVAAVMTMGDEIDTAFAKTRQTFGQTIDQIKNTAMYAFQPVMEKLTDALQEAIGNGLIQKFEVFFTNLAKVILIVFEIIERGVNWIADNWEWLKCIVIGVITAVTVSLIKMATVSFLAFLFNNPFNIWIIGIAVLVAALALLATACDTTCEFIYRVCFILAKAIIAILLVLLAIYMATGAIMMSIPMLIAIIVIGVLAILIATFIKWAAEIIGTAYGVGHYLGAVFDNIGIFFNNMIATMKSGWYSFIADLCDDFDWLLKAINSVAGFFGKSTITVEGLRAKSDAAASTVKDYVDLSAAYDTGYSKGYAIGEGWQNKINSFGKGKGGKQTALLDEIGNKLGLDFSDMTTPFPSTGAGSGYSPDYEKMLGGIGDDTGKIADSMDLTKEDLEYLRRIADMEWKKEYTTAEIKVDMTNNNQINGDSDLDGIVTRLADKLYEEMNVVANGVYAY